MLVFLSPPPLGRSRVLLMPTHLHSSSSLCFQCFPSLLCRRGEKALAECVCKKQIRLKNKKKKNLKAKILEANAKWRPNQRRYHFKITSAAFFDSDHPHFTGDKELAKSHKTKVWQSWDWNSGLYDSKLTFVRPPYLINHHGFSLLFHRWVNQGQGDRASGPRHLDFLGKAEWRTRGPDWQDTAGPLHCWLILGTMM